MLFIASIESNKFPKLNKLNDVSFIGSAIIACAAMLPMFVIQELVQIVFGRNEVFDLSFTFFLNNLYLHLFLTYVLDIKVKRFFIPITLFCLFCTILNGYREYDLITEFLKF
ncbi:hypothetical protein [uncultured Winogradskyella sp.]|uniref:hypothetical protein n=1 Tax=uncultured Winogradskyella sp. TaxID=395353 RepID=UPI0026026C63|nr:hypothetical protein [uncultured Winogradskyella sp.]